jgi:ABC-type uncharacterized transport system YnjBCD permease subunit
MQLFTIVFERLPMVWFLLGLLFNALALYIGFEASMFFVYLIVGWGCCIYGLALFVLQRMEKPKQSEKTRLSPNFISVGATTAMPVTPKEDREDAAEQPESN